MAWKGQFSEEITDAWLKAMEQAGPHFVQMRLDETDRMTPYIEVGEAPQRVDRDYAVVWLSKRMEREKADQSEREERMIKATEAAASAAGGAKRAAWAAVFTAVGSMIATGVQAYAALWPKR
jgi:hypothetical protein